jgi:hypothetical protein
VAEAFRQFLLKESGGLDEPPKEKVSAASGSSRARPQKAAGRRK